ncbi:hypothetical protein ACJW31_03G075000 [Castanea mollissima]
MGSLIYIYTIVLLFAVVPLGIAKEQLSSRECENLGFTGLALCSDFAILSLSMSRIKEHNFWYNFVL